MMSFSVFGYLPYLREFLIAMCVNVSSICFGSLAIYTVAYFMIAIDFTMRWYTAKWLILGLYLCPFLIGYAWPAFLKFKYTSSVSDGSGPSMAQGDRVQIQQHAQCTIFSFILITLTILGIRSAFILMIFILFYTITVAINIISQQQYKSYLWCYTFLVGQILPLAVISQITICYLGTMITHIGMDVIKYNPDLILVTSVICLTYCAFALIVSIQGNLLLKLLIQLFCISASAHQSAEKTCLCNICLVASMGLHSHIGINTCWLPIPRIVTPALCALCK